jgi:hypothetical protein
MGGIGLAAREVEAERDCGPRATVREGRELGDTRGSRVHIDYCYAYVIRGVTVVACVF